MSTESTRCHLDNGHWVGRIASLTASVLLFNTVAAPWAEANFWKERREAVPADSRSSALYAAVPLADFPSALPAVSHHYSPAVTLPINSVGLDIPPGLVSLPSSFGDVQQIRPAPFSRERPWVILIQDAHAVASAQKNIARILEHLQNNAPRFIVGLEGASGDFRLDPYRQFPDKEIHAAVSDYLLENDHISGPEYFGITATRAPALWGVESADQYLSNVEAYRAGLKLKAELQTQFARYDEHLANLRRVVLTPELRALDRSLSGYGGGDVDLLSHVRSLMSWAGDGIDGFPAVQALSRILKQEASMDFRAVEADRARLMAALAPALTHDEAQSLMRMSAAYKAGRVGYSSFYGFFSKLADSKRVSLENYPEFQNYVAYVSATEKIDRHALFGEVGRLGEHVLKTCEATAEQREVLRLGEDLSLLRRLMERELTSGEWGKYLSRRGDISRMETRLASLGRPSGSAGAGSVPLPVLVEALEEFYRAADRRDQSLLNNLLQKTGGPGDAPTAALVVGGFHTSGIARLLDEKKIPYAVVTPKIGEVSGKNSRYLDVFAVNHTPLEKMMLGERLFLSPPRALQATVTELSATAQDRAALQYQAAALAEKISRTLGNRPRVFSELTEQLESILQEFSEIFSRLFGGNLRWQLAGRYAPDSYSLRRVEPERVLYMQINGDPPSRVAAGGSSKSRVVKQYHPLSVRGQNLFRAIKSLFKADSRTRYIAALFLFNLSLACFVLSPLLLGVFSWISALGMAGLLIGLVLLVRPSTISKRGVFRFILVVLPPLVIWGGLFTLMLGPSLGFMVGGVLSASIYLHEYSHLRAFRFKGFDKARIASFADMFAAFRQTGRWFFFRMFLMQLLSVAVVTVHDWDGFVNQAQLSPEEEKNQHLIALVGPFTNLALVSLAVLLLPLNSPLQSITIVVNLLLGLANLLPLWGLDGWNGWLRSSWQERLAPFNKKFGLGLILILFGSVNLQNPQVILGLVRFAAAIPSFLPLVHAANVVFWSIVFLHYARKENLSVNRIARAVPLRVRRLARQAAGFWRGLTALSPVRQRAEGDGVYRWRGQLLAIDMLAVLVVVLVIALRATPGLVVSSTVQESAIMSVLGFQSFLFAMGFALIGWNIFKPARILVPMLSFLYWQTVGRVWDLIVGPDGRARRLFDFLAPRDPMPRHLNVIMVLGSDDLDTVVEAARLWHEKTTPEGGRVPIFISGGIGRLTPALRAAVEREGMSAGAETSEAEMLAWMLREKLGCKDAEIILETESTNSWENAHLSLRNPRLIEILSADGAPRAVALIQRRFLQLRAERTLARELENLNQPWTKNMRIYNHASSVDDAGRSQSIVDAANEFARLRPYAQRKGMLPSAIHPGLVRSYEDARRRALAEVSKRLGWNFVPGFGRLLRGMNVLADSGDGYLVLTNVDRNVPVNDGSGKTIEPRLFIRLFGKELPPSANFREGIDTVVVVRPGKADISGLDSVRSWAGKPARRPFPILKTVLPILLIGIVFVGIAVLISPLFLPHSGETLSMMGVVGIGLVGTMKPEEWYSTQPTDPNWVKNNASELSECTLVSLQMESAPDGSLMQKVRNVFIRGHILVRHLSQAYMTGGLGALMRDLIAAWSQNGMDTIAVHPLYEHSIKENPQTPVDGLPAEPVDGSAAAGTFGEVMRNPGVLSDTGIEISLTLNTEEYFAHAGQGWDKRPLNFKDRVIQVHFYQGGTRHGSARQFYVDAFALDDQGRKIRVFDELYPDTEYRDLQMAVYNEAVKELVARLQATGEWGGAKPNIIAVENEVLVSLPKPLAWMRFNVNHTVVPAGMWKSYWFSRFLLGFTEAEAQPYKVNVGGIERIEIARHIAQRTRRIVGVGLVEHTRVLIDSVFQGVRQVARYAKDYLRNTNGVLLEEWQAPEVRALVDRYKGNMGLDPVVANDGELFRRLESPENKALQESFLAEFEAIKCSLSLETLLWMHEKQPQFLGGNTWLADTLRAAGYAGDRIDLEITRLSGLSREARLLFMQGSDAQSLREAILSHPLASNVRRKVSYKGPDLYKLITRIFKADSEDAVDMSPYQLEEFLASLGDNPDAKSAFIASGVRLIIGGREFSREMYDLIKGLQSSVQDLGLQGQIAFIEDYNPEEARVIFHGMHACVMLSDEFEEASATGMMKGQINGAAMIGVLGGAMSEILKIRVNSAEVAGKKAVGQLLDLVEWKESIVNKHDSIRDWLRQGFVEILNGFLVIYSTEHSRDSMKGRRPDPLSLLMAFNAFGAEYKEDGYEGRTRRNLMWHSLTSSTRVDAARSQARAQMMIIREGLLEDKDVKQLFGGLNVSPRMARAILEGGTDFEWKYRPGGPQGPLELVLHGGLGLRNFVNDYYKDIRLLDESKRNDVMWHHSATLDIFDHLVGLLKSDGLKVQPMEAVILRIMQLKEKARSESDLVLRTEIGLRALSLANDLVPYLERIIADHDLELDTPVNVVTLKPVESKSKKESSPAILTRGMEERIIAGLHAAGVTDELLEEIVLVFDALRKTGVFGPMMTTRDSVYVYAALENFLAAVLGVIGIGSPDNPYALDDSLLSHEYDAHGWLDHPANEAERKELLKNVSQWLKAHPDEYALIQAELRGLTDESLGVIAQRNRIAEEFAAQVLSYRFGLKRPEYGLYSYLHGEEFVALMDRFAAEVQPGQSFSWDDIVATFDPEARELEPSDFTTSGRPDAEWAIFFEYHMADLLFRLSKEYEALKAGEVAVSQPFAGESPEQRLARIRGERDAARSTLYRHLNVLRNDAAASLVAGWRLRDRFHPDWKEKKEDEGNLPADVLLDLNAILSDNSHARALRDDADDAIEVLATIPRGNESDALEVRAAHDLLSSITKTRTWKSESQARRLLRRAVNRDLQRWIALSVKAKRASDEFKAQKEAEAEAAERDRPARHQLPLFEFGGGLFLLRSLNDTAAPALSAAGLFNSALLVVSLVVLVLIVGNIRDRWAAKAAASSGDGLLSGLPRVDSAAQRLFGLRRADIAAQLGLENNNLFDTELSEDNLRVLLPSAGNSAGDLLAAVASPSEDQALWASGIVDALANLPVDRRSDDFIFGLAVQDLAAALLPGGGRINPLIAVARWSLTRKIAARVISIRQRARTPAELNETAGGFVDATCGLSSSLQARLAKSKNLWIAVTDGPAPEWENQSGPRRTISLRDIEAFAGTDGAAVRRIDGSIVSVSVDALIAYLEAKIDLSADQIQTLRQIVVTPISPEYTVRNKSLGIRIVEWALGAFFELKPGELQERLKFQDDIRRLIERFA